MLLQMACCGVITAIIAFGAASTQKAEVVARDDVTKVVGAVTWTKDYCCMPEHRSGCANYYKCAATPTCTATTTYTWLWCSQAVCKYVKKNCADKCALTPSSTARCSNGCRPTGTTVATGCPNGQKKCVYDMYTWNDRVCPLGVCPGGKGTGVIPTTSHCAVISVCVQSATDPTQSSTLCSPTRGALCN